jgi:hypothetical protein
MRSWIKFFSLLSLLILPMACNQAAPEIAEETSKIETAPAPAPVVEEKAQVNLAKLEAKFLKHAKLLHPQWDQLPEEFQAKQLQFLRKAWVQAMQINVEDMKYDVDHVNRFLQFVRLAGGNKFNEMLEKVAQANFKAHAALAGAIAQQDDSLLNPFNSLIVAEAQVVMHLEIHIVEVSEIYGLKFEDPTVALPAQEHFVKEVITRLEEAFNGQMPPAGSPIAVRLLQLLHISSFGVSGEDQHFNFFSFVQVPNNYNASEDEVERFQVGNMLYGAIRVRANPYIRPDGN